MKCTKKRDARAELLFCLFNQLLFWRSRCRRRRGILKSLVSCSALFKAFLNLTECKQRIWFPESSGIRNPGLQNPQYSSKTRNRTKSHLKSRIQVPLTKTGIRSPRRGIQNPGLSWIPLQGAINLIKKKRRTIAIKEHKIGKPNEKGNICERNRAECNGQAKTIMRKCIFTCVNKTLLFTP